MTWVFRASSLLEGGDAFAVRAGWRCLGVGVPTELCYPSCVPRLSIPFVIDLWVLFAVSHLQVGHVAASARPNNKLSEVWGWEAQIWCRDCAPAPTPGVGVGLVGSARFPSLKKVPQEAEAAQGCPM